MSWRATIIALALLALGSGCTSGGTSSAERLFPLIAPLVLGEDEPVDGPEPTPITRALFDQVPFAAISLQIEGSEPAVVFAQEANGPYVVYQDAIRRSVVLHEGLMTGTRGLGYNLQAVKTQREDPIARRRPLETWPARINRSYQFTLRAQEDYSITVTCSYERVAAERIEIVERFHDVVRVHETCTNGTRTFVNVHWTEPFTGRIWQSRQWIGPRRDPFTIRVIRPFG